MLFRSLDRRNAGVKLLLHQCYFGYFCYPSNLHLRFPRRSTDDGCGDCFVRLCVKTIAHYAIQKNQAIEALSCLRYIQVII